MYINNLNNTVKFQPYFTRAIAAPYFTRGRSKLGWWRHPSSWWQHVFSDKRFFAQVFAISRYSACFDLI